MQRTFQNIGILEFDDDFEKKIASNWPKGHFDNQLVMYTYAYSWDNNETLRSFRQKSDWLSQNQISDVEKHFLSNHFGIFEIFAFKNSESAMLFKMKWGSYE